MRPIGSAVAHEANGAKADVAQLAERVLGKDEVTSSILVIGSNLSSRLLTMRELRLTVTSGQEEKTRSSLLERAKNAYGEREI